MLIGAIIFLPALYVVWLSLTQSSFGQQPVFVGLAQLRQVLGDPYFWRALSATPSSSFSSSSTSNSARPRCRAPLRQRRYRRMPLLLAVVLAPYAVSEVSAVVMWRYLFDLDIGYVSQALAALGLPAAGMGHQSRRTD